MKDSERDYFSQLPRWLQEDILREEAGRDEILKAKYKRKIQSIEDACALRGYGLLPTRGVSLTRLTRRPVGDFSINEANGDA